MPTPAEVLGPSSTDDEIKAAIQATIAQLVREGREQRQAVAMAYDMARRATGRSKGALAMTRAEEA